MNIIIETSGASLLSHRRAPSRQKCRSRWDRESSKRSANHETPLVNWMLSEYEFIHQSNSVVERDKTSADVGRTRGGTIGPSVSARKLAAGIWRLQLPDFGTNGRQRVGFQFEPSLKVPNSPMERATNFLKPAIRSPLIPTLEKHLKQARARISELEAEESSSKDKLEQFLQKFNEERASWRSREHEKVHAIVDDMKAELSREKKTRQRLEIVHSKLVNELADAKLSYKRCLQQYGKERKARELAQEVCDELAREIGGDKAEFETLKIETKKLWEEMEDERKMLQMAEVWREERVKMKLVDAKVMLEEKNSQMNKIITDIEAFQKSRSTYTDLKDKNKANPDKCFSFEGIDFGESNKREASPTVTPELKLLDKYNSCRRDVYMNRSGEQTEDATVWESLSQSDDQGSSCSTNGSDRCANSKRPPNFKKASSMSRLRRSCLSHGAKYKMISVKGVNQKF